MKTKKLVVLLGMLIFIPSVFATVSLDAGGDNIITFTSSEGSGHTGADRAYWAVWMDASACTITSVSCVDPYVDCNYYSTDSSIRVVSYTAPTEGSWAITTDVVVTGTDSCVIQDYSHVESYFDDPSERLGAVIGVTGAGYSLDMGPGCCANPSDTYPTCDGISWSEIDSYITNWATSTQVCGETITWSILDGEITAWAVG